MATDRFVVIGGDAAGMSAASKAKREDPDVDVVVFEKGDWVSYAACGMPYYVKGDVGSLDDLVAIEPERFREERGIDLRTGHEVTAIDPDADPGAADPHDVGGTVTVEGPDGTIEEPYDALLVATGASAIVPPFDGVELDGVHTIHDMDDAGRLRDVVAGGAPMGEGYGESSGEYAAAAPDTVALVGGGYVGMEMAEAFRERGCDVHLFEMLPHVLAPFGDEVADRVERHLEEQGVALHLETAVEAFEGDGSGHVTAVQTEDGTVDVDLVLVGVGVAPNTGLAEEAGVSLGESGAIAVDGHGRTDVPGIYAAGDCAEARHVVTGEPTHVPLALTANRSGRAIGATVAGDPTPVGAIAGTAVVKVFEQDVGRTGVIDHERAADAGFDPVSKTITAPTRAHYYPGAGEIQITLTADADSGRVLGAAMAGDEGVAKRLDTVATALHAGMTVGELTYCDLSYAPPYSPVWDPVLTAAKVLGGAVDAEPPEPPTGDAAAWAEPSPAAEDD